MRGLANIVAIEEWKNALWLIDGRREQSHDHSTATLYRHDLQSSDLRRLEIPGGAWRTRTLATPESLQQVGEEMWFCMSYGFVAYTADGTARERRFAHRSAEIRAIRQVGGDVFMNTDTDDAVLKFEPGVRIDISLGNELLAGGFEI